MSNQEDKNYKKHQHVRIFKKHFNYKHHKGYQSTNTYMKSTNSGIIFHGNSAMEFRQVVDRLDSAFREEACFDLISNEGLDPDEDGLFPETTFDDVKPVEPDYDLEITIKNDLIRTNAQNMINLARRQNMQINAAVGQVEPVPRANRRRGGRGAAAGNDVAAGAAAVAPAAEQAVEPMGAELIKTINAIEMKMEIDIQTNEQTRDEREIKWKKSLDHYRKNKKEHDEKVARALKVFNKTIGQKGYDHIKRYMRTNPPQLRRAYNTLKNVYHLSHGGTENAIEILQLLEGEKFNYPYQLAHQYVSKIEDYAIRANEISDGIVKPEMLMGYIIKGIEKNEAGSKEYHLDIDDIRRNDRSLEEAKTSFQKHDSRIQLQRMNEKNVDKEKRIKINALKKHHPNKQEGSEKSSKSDITCYNCNKKGHYASECPLPKKHGKNVQFSSDAEIIENESPLNELKHNAKPYSTPRTINKFNKHNVYADLIYSTQKTDHLLVTICDELAEYLKLSDANSLDSAGSTELSSVDPGQQSNEYGYVNYQLRSPTLNLTVNNVNVIMDSGASSSMFPTENAFRHLEFKMG